MDWLAWHEHFNLSVSVFMVCSTLCVSCSSASFHLWQSAMAVKVNADVGSLLSLSWGTVENVWLLSVHLSVLDRIFTLSLCHNCNSAFIHNCNSAFIHIASYMVDTVGRVKCNACEFLHSGLLVPVPASPNFPASKVSRQKKKKNSAHCHCNCTVTLVQETSKLVALDGQPIWD